MNSSDVYALINKGGALLALEKNDEAITYFDQVLSMNASDVYAINNKAEALAEMGKNEEALSVIEKAAIDNPKDETLQSTMAFILAKMGKDDEARLYYEKALKINPNLTEILYEDELDEFNRVMGNKTTQQNNNNNNNNNNNVNFIQLPYFYILSIILDTKISFLTSVNLVLYKTCIIFILCHYMTIKVDVLFLRTLTGIY